MAPLAQGGECLSDSRKRDMANAHGGCRTAARTGQWAECEGAIQSRVHGRRNGGIGFHAEFFVFAERALRAKQLGLAWNRRSPGRAGGLRRRCDICKPAREICRWRFFQWYRGHRTILLEIK